MKESELHAALDRLRTELARTDIGDPSAKEHLRQLIEDIDRHAGGDSSAPEREALLDRLGNTIRRLEVRHPNFTGYLGQIVSALSNMGI
jgi:hypothetical protein